MMTREEQLKMLYQRSAPAGHQVPDYAQPPPGVVRHVQPRSMIAHSATSAFRPAGAHQVPYQQHGASPRLSAASGKPYYPQQQVASRRVTSEHTAYTKVVRQQEHLFQGPPALHNARVPQYQANQRPVTGANVRSQAPGHMYQREQQLAPVQQEREYPEALHEELCMLHAMHYQDKMIRKEDLDYMWKQSVGANLSGRGPMKPSPQNLYQIQRGENLLQQGKTYPKHPVQRSPGAYQQQPQRHQYMPQEEMYHTQRQQYAMNSSSQPNRTTLPPTGSYPAEMKTRAQNVLPQGASQPGRTNHADQYLKEYMPPLHRVASYPNHEISKQQRYYTPNQPHSNASTHVQQYQRHVQAPYPDTYRNVNTSQQRVLNMQSKFDMPHETVKAKLPERGRGGTTPDFSDVICIKDIKTEKRPNVVPDPRGSGYKPVVNRGPSQYVSYPVESKEYSQRGGQSDQDLVQTGEKQEEYDSKRLSNAAVSIKQEQMLLKEELELSLQRAAIQCLTREVKPASVHDSPDKFIVNSSSDVASLPKIVKVQSLAVPEKSTSPASVLEAPNRDLHNVAPAAIGDSNGKHAKHKSRMIKAHQDLYDMQSGVLRVSSRGSMDSETGRKDSWDSGIESPPWPDFNREALNLTRASSLSLGQRVKQEDSSNEMLGVDMSCTNTTCTIEELIVKCERESSSVETANMKGCEIPSATPSTSQQLPSRQLQGNVGMEEEVNMRKRTWSSESLCPIEAKILHRTPEVLDFSSGKTLSIEKTENKDGGPDSGGNTLTDSKSESPLDLSIKKQTPPSCEGARCGTSDDQDDNELSSSDSQIQGYFGNMMMRVLKRLWSSKEMKEGEPSETEAKESTDDNQPKFFQPGAILRNMSDGDKEQWLANKTSMGPLENALCQLMQQSSGTFKNWGDIFHHFDVMIKRELFLEMQNQPATSSESPSSSKTEKAQSLSEKQTSDLKGVSDEEQTSEAVALCSDTLCSDAQTSEEVDTKADLVIVESSWSPDVLPDSQLSTCREGEAKALPDQAPKQASGSSVELGVGVPDSSVRDLSPSPSSIYEKAARDAASKAARLAEEKSLKQAPEREASENCAPDNESTLRKMTCLYGAPSDVATTTPLKKVPAQNMDSTTSLSPGQSQQNKHTTISCSQAMTGVDPRTTGRERELGGFPQHSYNVRCFSEPAKPNNSHQCLASFHEAPEPLQRPRHEKGHHGIPPIPSQSISPQHGVSQYRKIVPKHMQPQELHGNQIRMMTVPAAQVHEVQAGKLHQLTSQQDFPQSPIVLLPKMVCIPGQMYQESQIRMAQNTKSRGSHGLQASESKATQGPVSSPPQGIAGPSASPSEPSENHQTEEDYIDGPFRVIRKPVPESQSKKHFVNAFLIMYKNVSLPGVVRSGIPFVPPRILQEGLFPEKTFDEFCSTLHECSIMQRYMTVLERSALLPDLKRRKISSCKLVSLEEIHQKYDAIKLHLEGSTFRRLSQPKCAL